MYMTLHAMLMIHMQKPGSGYYGGRKELTSKYSQTCKLMLGEPRDTVCACMCVSTQKACLFPTV